MKVSLSTIGRVISNEKPLAVILGKYAATGLGVCRCLGKMNIPTLWLDRHTNQIGFLSKYCTAGLICPHPKQEEYADFLIRLGKKLPQKAVLFPLGDAELTALLKHKKTLQQYFHFPMADFSRTQLLLSKKKFYQTLDKYNIPHPLTFFPQSESDVAFMSKELSYPCILKPVDSESFRVAFKTKFFRVASRKELLENYQKVLSKKQEVIIQEIIPGDARHMYGFNAYYDQSFNPHGICMFRRMREWPPLSGNGVCIERVSMPEFEPFVSSFIRKIRYHGIVDVEIKHDPRDNCFKLIEINARCWMQVSFPLVHGCNIPYIAYLDAIGALKERINPLATDAKWFFMFQDIPAALRSISCGTLTFKEWMHSYKGKKEYAIFSWDDPLPFFAGLSYILRRLLSASSIDDVLNRP
jgi:D-aspartate ligase